MKTYTHPVSKRLVNGYSSHKAHCFYETTTKRQMYLIIEQMAEMLKEKDQDWVDRAESELSILKINGIN